MKLRRLALLPFLVVPPLAVVVFWTQHPREAPAAIAVAVAPAPESPPPLPAPAVRSAPALEISPVAAAPGPARSLQPTEADEEALIRLLEETKREANSTTRHERLVAICLRWASFDPPAAIALALESGLNPLEGALVPNLAQQWAARDFAAAQAWAGRLPAGELRDEVYSRLSYELAAHDPAAGARLLALMRPAGSAREEAAISIVHLWAQRDRSAASAWVQTFAVGPLRQRALLELATFAPPWSGGTPAAEM